MNPHVVKSPFSLHMYISLIISALAVFSTCAVPGNSQEWATYRYDGEVTFMLEYPATWTTLRERGTVRFMPPEDDVARIEIVVYDPEATPPLAVHVTYDTLRVVDSIRGPIPVMKRDPAAVTEQYVAMVRINSHVAEFRLHAEHEYDVVFDHMLITTTNHITSPSGGRHE
jgi:hypothetical protein